jgi:uncharacterized protein involved in outer membrane biogenesis
MIPAKEPPPRPERRSKWFWLGAVTATLCVAVCTLWLVWDWNWFRTLLEARASAAIGRPLTIERLEVQPGRITVLTAYGVRIANPSGFTGPDFATFPRLSLTFEAETWWHTGRYVIPTIEADQPDFNVVQAASGQNNWVAIVPLPTSDQAAPVAIGSIDIKEGVAHVQIAQDKSDVTMSIATGHAANGSSLMVSGKGAYAGQPMTFRATGGALLSVTDATKPYPVDLTVINGGTRVTLKGHVRDPLALTGADLRMELSGPDMALLFPLIGIATPETPSYQVDGRLDFADGRIRFSEIKGRVGSSDLSGELEVDPRGARRILTGSLTSRQVDMEDLAGFIGAAPGRTTTPGQTAGQVDEVKRAEASPKLLPTKQISVPKTRAVDVHLTYRGDKILGKNTPFDSISVKLDIDAGHIRLAPVRFGMDGGAVSGTIDLVPVGNQVDANADVTLDRVKVARLLATAGLGHGDGLIDGSAKFKGRGDSLSTVLAHGDGEFHADMPAGGDINSLLIDLLGAEFGRALFAAIGIPDKEAISCMTADFILRNGILASHTLEMNTTDHVITGGGRIDLSREVMEAQLRTDPKHFTIGTLSTPMLISGSFKDLKIAPAPDLAIRGGVAIGIGILFPPAAVLPTIQFGVGEKSRCAEPAAPSPK